MAVATPIQAVVGRADGIRETVALDAAVLAHVCTYRQLSQFAVEAGGQLFGTVAHHRVTVSVATGPYCRDERTCYHYRSHPASAQRVMRRQAKAGLIYLGEWHTHPENRPNPSRDDNEAIRALKAQSEIRVRSLLLLIVGRRLPPENLCLCSTDGGPLQFWNVTSLGRE